MIIGTTEAAFLLGVCTQRLRQLLACGRIKGAKKVGRFWQIPLYRGMPKVIPGSRGPTGKWRKELQRTCTYIHVNQQALRKNKKYQTKEPVILVKQGIKTTYCHEVEIAGASRLVYRSDAPKCTGASICLEVDPKVAIVTKIFGQN
jgi:Pyruvate/2-oxoacid:ferredoxin oxidoreductase delta subunit